jgi:hypothetical protein
MSSPGLTMNIQSTSPTSISMTDPVSSLTDKFAGMATDESHHPSHSIKWYPNGTQCVDFVTGGYQV